MVKRKLLDTAYLTWSQWREFNQQLISLNILDQNFMEVDATVGSKFGKTINEYKIYYSLPKTTQTRKIKKDIKNLWSKFDNPLSKSFK